MSYYRVISHLGNRKYLIESLNNGTPREMQIKYKTVVRVSESGCQIIENVAPVNCKCASSDLVFVKNAENNAIYPIERFLRPCDVQSLKVNDVVEIEFRNSKTGLYIVTQISNTGQELGLTLDLREIEGDKRSVANCKVSEIVTIKSLETGYKLLYKVSPILIDSSGEYYEYDAISFAIDHKYILQPEQIINIVTPEEFSITEIAEQLGTTLPIVAASLLNIVPDNTNGNGLTFLNIIRQCNDLSDLKLTQGESYRLFKFLQRPDTQCKSIIRWKYYINIKNSNIPCPGYLDVNNNIHKEEISYQHLDMGKYAKIIDWLSGKVDIANEIESYFTLFHTLYWSDQIRFLKKILINHILRLHVLTDITKLELLIQYPQYVNINVLIFIHTLLKLNKDRALLSNVELYHIWKSHLPQKSKGKYGLSLKDYVGTNLFCMCRGAIGFGIEDWWSPGINADSKPVLYISPDGQMDLVADFISSSEITPTLESIKEHRGFVVYRDCGDMKNCHYAGWRIDECPVVASIKNDNEYRDQIFNMTSKNLNQDLQKGCNEDENAENLFEYKMCPLISVPSWKNKWAEKYRDKCSVDKSPRITALYLWHKRNKNGKNHLFCEGVTAKKDNKAALHKVAKLPFSWCNGNACFTDEIYVVPPATEIASHFNIYSVAVLLGLINESSKTSFQYFHSRLNWLNIAMPHLYCDNCNCVLEASGEKQYSNSAHSIVWFECKNSQCSELHKSVYISHCWNDRCRSVIDSRQTSQCPNNKYICPTCGVCCGDRMFNLKKQSGLYCNNARHFEEGKFFCRKCGKQMIKQGNVYYCADHPDVVTKPPKFDRLKV